MHLDTKITVAHSACGMVGSIGQFGVPDIPSGARPVRVDGRHSHGLRRFPETTSPGTASAGSTWGMIRRVLHPSSADRLTMCRLYARRRSR